MRSRALTQTLPRPNLSLIVEQFKCQCHSITNQIGTNASHRLWRVRALGHGTQATETIALSPPASTAGVYEVGDLVEIWSDTQQAWCGGCVIELRGAGELVNVKATAPDGQTFEKQVPKGHEHLRHSLKDGHVTQLGEEKVDTSPIERQLRSITMEVVTDSGVGGMKAKVVGTQVMISADGQQLFPRAPQARARMYDDFQREWKFRSLYPGVGFLRPGELWVPGTLPTDVPSQPGDAANFLQTRVLGDGKLKTMHEVQVGPNMRCPAVLTKQWPNGCFAVTAFKSDDWGIVRPMEFPTMHKCNIFLTSNGENIELPEGVVSLEVPMANPQSACAFLEGDSFVECLGRVSPRASDVPPRRIVLDVPKPIRPENQADAAKKMVQQNMLGMLQQEKPVDISVSAPEWEHFLSGEVRRGDTAGTRLTRCWTVQLGPFATHTLKLEKPSHVHSVMTLYVDDEILVECSALDLGGFGASADVWRCKFRFVGERHMDFKVFEETKDGWPQDSKCMITQPTQYRHDVEVVYPHRKIDNVTEAVLTIDGVPFGDLPSMVPLREGLPNLTITPRVLQTQFKIEIPRKVLPQDTRGIARQMASNVVEQAGGWTAIGEAASKTIEDVGASLSKLGLNAWDVMFLQRGEAASKTIEDVGASLSKLGLNAWDVMFLQRGSMPYNPRVMGA